MALFLPIFVGIFVVDIENDGHVDSSRLQVNARLTKVCHDSLATNTLVIALQKSFQWSVTVICEGHPRSEMSVRLEVGLGFFVHLLFALHQLAEVDSYNGIVTILTVQFISFQTITMVLPRSTCTETTTCSSSSNVNGAEPRGILDTKTAVLSISSRTALLVGVVPVIRIPSCCRLIW